MQTTAYPPIDLTSDEVAEIPPLRVGSSGPGTPVEGGSRVDMDAIDAEAVAELLTRGD